MLGAICKRDIVGHPFVTIHCFGWRIFFRALLANRYQTFLALLVEGDMPRPAEEPTSKLVERCVELERRAEEIYDSLANRFVDNDGASEFFDTLARQEETHAELLELCQEVAGRSAWDKASLARWRDALPRLERQMWEAESSIESVDDLSVALRLVIQIESSEVNEVFLGIVAAADSAFVRKLRVFNESTAEHLSYIRQSIPELERGLAEECKKVHV